MNISTGKQVLAQVAANKFKRWIPATEAEVGNSRTAMSRISTGEIVTPNVTPKFKMKKTDKVFTIGSCFARNVEQALVEQGCTVLTMELNIQKSLLVETAQIGNSPASIRAILNKYSTSAIRNEIERTLGNDNTRGFIEVRDGGFFIDPHLSLLKPMPLDALIEVRREVNRIIRMLVSADIVFITLGLTETWKDMETGLFLNASPPMHLLVKDKGRFVFENCSVARAIEDMEATINKISYLRPNMKFILTVSPVPMNTTFTKSDVIIANTYSKSALRVTAQHLYEKFDHVDYFPSFEMVMMSPRELAFGPDQLHVRQPMVNTVVSHFLANYLE